MTLVQLMADALHDKGVAIKSKTVFTNNIPATVGLAVGLFGKLTGDTIDYELKGFRKTTFQLVVRCQLLTDGEVLIRQAVEAITFEKRTDFPGFQINYIRPKHDPVNYPISDGNKTEFSVNFDACFVIV